MIMIDNTIKDIRAQFVSELQQNHITTNGNKTGSETIELINACFLADEPVIFGTLNTDYAEREIEWYNSQSLNVNDIPGGAPAIWKQVATPEGLINSNYGWMIFSTENSSQYANCLATLSIDKYTRRAVMIYTRPSMQYDYCKGGMSDFCCTNHVQVFIRPNWQGEDTLYYIVSQRSSDAVYGFKNDNYHHQNVYQKLYTDLLDYYPELKMEDVIYQIGSLHVYRRHFHLIEE